MVLAAWYVLRFYQGSTQDAPPQPASFPELRTLDVGVLAPLLALMVVIFVIGLLIDFGFSVLDRRVRARRGLETG